MDNSEEVVETRNEAHHDTPEISFESPLPKQKPNSLKIESSDLAAAIVNSAPLHRRRVFLQSSQSFDQSTLCSPVNSDLKRQSWHVERVTARMLSVLEEAGSDSSLSILPAFNRSLSTDLKHQG
jgi:hypothetical protein